MANKSILMYFLVGGFAIVNLLSAQCKADPEKEINVLLDFKAALKDPDRLLASWNSMMENPCFWFHVTCDDNKNVIRLDLGHTNISGPISPRIGQLTNLQYLDLYNSRFNGTLPDSLGNLKNLKELDLSLNELTGKIPTSFTRLNNLHFLNLSYNQLSGPIPTGGLFQIFGITSFEGNPGLCGPLIGKRC